MKRLIPAILCFAFAGTAHAGIYSDEMAKCLVSATSQKDKTDLVRWVFANAVLHPDIANIASLSDQSRDEMNRNIAALLERLLTVTCRKESSEAIKYEGPVAFHQSFRVLGEVAMHELMANKAVGAGFQDFMQYVDLKKIGELGER